MKRSLQCLLVLTTFILLQNISFSQLNQDWRWVNPKPQGSTLKWVKAFTKTSWAAIGFMGTFMKTTNAGATWNVYSNAGGTSPTSGQGNSLYSGWFINENTGIVCGSDKWIGRTTNGGLSWDSIFSPAGTSGTILNSIHFINNTTGFIGGTNGVLLKSTNAGLMWSSITGLSYTLNNIFAIDENHIYAVSPNYFIMTSNGGLNWITNIILLNNPFDVYFMNYNTGFICGNYASVLLTTNSGVNWIYRGVGLNFSFLNLYPTYLPYGYSYLETFSDSITFPPAGWRTVNVRGNSAVWVRTTSESFSPPASALIPFDCDFSSGGGLDWLITSQFAIIAGDSLSFRLRLLTSGANDSLCIRISNTDTALSSFTTRVLYLADGINYPPENTWAKYSASLNQFAGQNVYIGFKHQNLCGDGLFLDDISIISQNLQTLNLYAVGDTGFIYSSTNLGSNWTATKFLEPDQPYTAMATSMDIFDSTIIVVGNNGIFNVSSNNGANWISMNHRTGKGRLYDIWCNTGTGKVWAVGEAGNSGSTFDQVLFSSNGGTSFQIQNVGNSKAYYTSICMLNDNTGFIAGCFGSIRKTINGGNTWDSLVTPIPNYFDISSMDFVDENTGWVFALSTNAGGTIWMSTNRGLNWTQQSLADFSTFGQRIYDADMVNANTGCCVNLIPVIHATTNGGLNWLAKTPKLNVSVIYEINMVNDSSGYACGLGKLYRTTNLWNSFDSIIIPVQAPITSAKWADMQNGFLLTSAGLTLRTTNGGVVWEYLPTSSNASARIFIKTIDTAFIVGNSASILKFQKGLVNITWKNEVLSQYYLGQNYPNPFNPVTQFNFGLASRGKVSLKVYDVLGRLVQTYFDNIEINPGTITIKFDGSNLASGVYFYVLLIDEKRIDTKKMLMIK